MCYHEVVDGQCRFHLGCVAVGYYGDCPAFIPVRATELEKPICITCQRYEKHFHKHICQHTRLSITNPHMPCHCSYYQQKVE